MLAKLRAAHEKALQEEPLSFASHSRVGTVHALRPGLSGPSLAATSHPLRRTVPILQPTANKPASIPSLAPPSPSPLPREPDPTHIPVPDPPPSIIYEEPPLISDFNERKARIEELMFEHHTAANLGEACPCGTKGAERTTVCRECWHLPASCSHCFVRHHINNPTHWAEVWSKKRGYFAPHDISALGPGSGIYLGHGGEKCIHAQPDDGGDYSFIVVDTNGVHSTKVYFCKCYDGLPPYEQLLSARLFPSTFRSPRSAFTFTLLNTFHIHHLEGAQTAYSFMAALRHLTNKYFFKDAADLYDQFRDVFSLWRLLVAEMHQGQMHGIDSHFPHRGTGNLAIFCPSCLELGVNTRPEELAINDPKFRHLNQVSFSADGNFHANHYPKGSIIKRISLSNGRAYVTETEAYRVYKVRQTVKAASDANKEKTTCSFLKAVNRQEKAKFKGTDISGILNIQCHHIFILASVDMELGEKFQYADFAIYWALLRRGVPSPEIVKFIDFLFSYDISCAFRIKAEERFRSDDALLKVLPIVKKFRYLIPLVHVQNHKDNCDYLYSCSYTSSAGHFHGETAEHAWTYLNLFAGQGRQMSHANRHDLYNDAFGHWNFKKMMQLPSQLFSDLVSAKETQEEKTEVFIGLSKLHHDKVSQWNTEDREKRNVTTTDREVRCVYRENPSKLPSQNRIYQVLIQQLQADEESKDTPNSKSLPLLVKHSISIRILQQKIRCNLAMFTKTAQEKFKTSAQALRIQLRKTFERFRQLQVLLAPQVIDDVAAICPDVIEFTPELQPLHMPSDYNEVSQVKLGFGQLAAAERKLLEGTAYDTLEKIRTSVRLLSALVGNEKSSAYSQSTHTRAKAAIIDATLQRDINLAAYTSLRSSLLRLGFPSDDAGLRPLTLADTYRKPTQLRRAVGDRGRNDGVLWTGGFTNSERREIHRPLINPQALDESDVVATQSSQNLKRKNNVSATSQKKAKLEAGIEDKANHTPQPPSPDGGSHQTNLPDVVESREDGVPAEKAEGWIWKIQSSSKDMTDTEVEAYLSESDKVQWFRAEAAMLRWQEEWERKLLEFFRCIRYFDKMANVWDAMSRNPNQPVGKAAFARKTSKVYKEMAMRARKVFDQLKYPVTDSTVIDYIKADRASLEANVLLALTNFR